MPDTCTSFIFFLFLCIYIFYLLFSFLSVMDYTTKDLFGHFFVVVFSSFHVMDFTIHQLCNAFVEHFCIPG